MATRLANPKSQPGENGHESNNETNQDCEKLTIQDPYISPDSPLEEEDVKVVDEFDSKQTTTPPTLSPSDIKLAIKMTRAISNHLGLSGRSRSIRIQ